MAATDVEELRHECSALNAVPPSPADHTASEPWPGRRSIGLTRLPYRTNDERATDQSTGIDQFLEAVDISVKTFGLCEIGRHFSLRCQPIDSVIVHFVLRGTGILECEHGSIPLTAGMAAIIPRMLPKQLSGQGPVLHVRDADANCTSGSDLTYFRACDGAADFVLGCAELSSKTGDQLPLFEQLTRPIVERSGDPLLQRLFTTMLDELQNPRLGSRAFVGTLMKQVLIVLLRSQPSKDSSALLMTNARLAGAVAAILDRPAESHTVESLAAIAGMSRSSFSHHFTEAYNLSPKAFVQEARLAAAARILKASDLPVKSVAASVGYASRSHFSRVFQARFSVDPTAFRRSSSSAAA